MLLLQRPLLDRRSFLAGAAASGVLASLPAYGAAPFSNVQVPAWYRFKLGEFEATIISDGPLALGEPSGAFKGAPKDELNQLLTDNFLPTDNVVLEQNALVLNTGRQLLLFDTGMGSSKLFGPTTGRLLANLKAAGFEPGQIDGVIITHTHSDHCWGVSGDDGRPTFPNAQVYLPQADFEFWTADLQPGQPDWMKDFLVATRKALMPVRERMVFVQDGKEVVPGVTAMAAPGHTIGHTAYVITSGSRSLLFSGDLSHHQIVLLQRPKLEFSFDSDPKQAVASRIRAFDMAAANRLEVLSYHFPFPGLGHVTKAGEGYVWHPTPMRTML